MKELRSIGIQPDILLCRTDRPIPQEERRKLALFCNVRESAVIEARDVDNIYAVPEAYHGRGPRHARCWPPSASTPRRAPDLARWQLINERIRNPEGEVTIAIVGKYTGMKDAYKSLIEALSHGGIANKVKVNLDWIESRGVRERGPGAVPRARQRHPGAGRLRPARRRGQDPGGAVRARAQRAVFRHLLRHADGGDRGGAQSAAASRRPTRPSSAPTPEPVVGLMTEWLQGQRAARSARPTATSAAPCGSAPIRPTLQRGSRVAEIYGATEISERHRHRYEVNTAYKDRLEQHGMRFSGMSPDGLLPEIVEYAGPSLVHRRAVPPRAEVAAVRAASAVRVLHRRGGGAEPAGLTARCQRHVRARACQRKFARCAVSTICRRTSVIAMRAAARSHDLRASQSIKCIPGARAAGRCSSAFETQDARQCWKQARHPARPASGPC